MTARKTLIWLDDNPDILKDETDFYTDVESCLNDKYDILLWDGKFDSSQETRAEKCIKDFANNVKEFSNHPERVAGFIIDLRIATSNLQDLELEHIQTGNGLHTGEKIADSYLRNNHNKSPIKDAFKNTPILFLSVTHQVGDNEWTENDLHVNFICKTKDDSMKKIGDWLKTLS